MTTELERQAAKVTGRKYGSVADLMRGEGVSQEVQGKVKELENETRVVDYLARLRQGAGLTQEDMAAMWEHSLIVAHAAKTLGSKINSPSMEQRMVFMPPVSSGAWPRR